MAPPPATTPTLSTPLRRLNLQRLHLRNQTLRKLASTKINPLRIQFRRRTIRLVALLHNRPSPAQSVRGNLRRHRSRRALIQLFLARQYSFAQPKISQFSSALPADPGPGHARFRSVDQPIPHMTPQLRPRTQSFQRQNHHDEGALPARQPNDLRSKKSRGTQLQPPEGWHKLARPVRAGKSPRGARSSKSRESRRLPDAVRALAAHTTVPTQPPQTLPLHSANFLCILSV